MAAMLSDSVFKEGQAEKREEKVYIPTMSHRKR